MPKKFAGENSKAVAARQRKAAVKDAEVSKKQKEIEEAYWKDDDKQLVKKQQRKEAEEKKKQAQLEKKAEAKALLEKEMESLKKAPSKPPPPVKITRAQIEQAKQPVKKEKEKEIETHLTIPLEENINRAMVEGEEARSVTEAISILSVNSAAQDKVDKHPEKRMKAAYTAYEERRLAELKAENPSLRLSQLKQMIFKEWQKSPENPLNKT
ncbi:coiled-coil domain-containing protein 124-like [Onthophagus taurus]|uniref:coiled-coil domain-containing protein 124-like n=1 Tax=Onthophagus taurus TaxID=166361 RepID=UPI000C206B26|nr:coiled-coil domain-containing protein 124-like [Onthophagus taurus]